METHQVRNLETGWIVYVGTEAECKDVRTSRNTSSQSSAHVIERAN